MKSAGALARNAKGKEGIKLKIVELYGSGHCVQNPLRKEALLKASLNGVKLSFLHSVE